MNAVIYAAKSTVDKHRSIDDDHRSQLTDCQGMAERESWNVLGEPFTEEAVSAYHGNRGPQLAAAIRLAVANAPCILVAQDSDRFARGAGDKPGAARHLAELWFELARQDVELWTVRSRKLDLLRAAIEGDRAHDETARKAQAVAAGIERVKAKGKPWGGVSCGYKIERTVVDDEVIAKRVVDSKGREICDVIWSMIESGHEWQPIAEALNRRGWRTKRGNLWTPPVVRDLAKNPIYVGEKGHPPLIERERWERIQELIGGSTPVSRQRQKGGRPLAHASLFLLRGLSFCRECGEPIHIRSDKSGYYTCRARKRGTGMCTARPIPRAVADEHVLAHLDQFIDDVEDWLTEKASERSADLHRREAAVERERAKLAGLIGLRAKLWSEYERLVAEGDRLARYGLEAVERKDQEIDGQRARIADAGAMASEWRALPHLDAALDYYNSVVEAIRGKVRGAASVPELNAQLSTVLAGVWLSYDGSQLIADARLRPRHLTEDELADLEEMLSNPALSEDDAAHLEEILADPEGTTLTPVVHVARPGEPMPETIERTKERLSRRKAEENPVEKLDTQLRSSRCSGA